MSQVEERKTNVEIVTDIMEYSRRGVLAQAFVMVALEKYAEQVVKHGAAIFDTPFMNGEAWVDCAKEVLEKLKTPDDSK